MCLITGTSSTQLPDLVVTADTLQWLRSYVPMSVSNKEALFSSNYIDTTWMGFRLDGRFSPLVAFFAQSVFVAKNYPVDSTISYATTAVNEGR